MKTYRGFRGINGTPMVTVYESGQEHVLDARLDLMKHSPTGIEWGYTGSGPAQLALAILADYLQNDHKALSYYQDFKLRVIARLDRTKDWAMSEMDIFEALQSIKEARHET
jgi:hypothetical protein